MFTVQSHKIIPQPLVKVEIQELTVCFLLAWWHAHTHTKKNSELVLESHKFRCHHKPLKNHVRIKTFNWRPRVKQESTRGEIRLFPSAWGGLLSNRSSTCASIRHLVTLISEVAEKCRADRYMLWSGWLECWHVEKEHFSECHCCLTKWPSGHAKCYRRTYRELFAFTNSFLLVAVPPIKKCMMHTQYCTVGVQYPR